MSTAKNGQLRMEVGQKAFPVEQATDSGDAITFETSLTKFSNVEGKSVKVITDGALTGLTLTSSGTSDSVDVAAGTYNLGGQKRSLSAGSVTIDRAITDTHLINSIVIDEAGVITVESGTEGTSFSETRGSAGGPALISVGKIEIAQVRVSSQSSAVVNANEIYQVEGLHKETSDDLYDTDSFEATVVFDSALPKIHVGPVTKGVYVEAFEPIMSKLVNVTSFVPPEESQSISSETTIGDGTIGSVSTSLNSGSFDIKMKNGVTDSIVKNAGKNLHFEFYPDKNLGDVISGQSFLAISRTFNGDERIAASCTLNPEKAWNNIGA